MYTLFLSFYCIFLFLFCFLGQNVETEVGKAYDWIELD